MKVKADFPKAYEDAINHIMTRDRRHIALYGGRGGGKTKNAADALVITAMKQPTRICAGREFENTVGDSVHQAFERCIAEKGLAQWEISEKRILNKDNGSEIIFRGLRTSKTSGMVDAQRIKSLEDIDIFWGEEAQSFSSAALRVLIPTIRKPHSMFIWTMNRTMKDDPIWERIMKPRIGKKNQKDSKPYDDGEYFIQKINSYDIEQYLTSDLINEREDLKKLDPEAYRQDWLGEPLTSINGGIFSKQLAETRNNKRIGEYPYDARYEVYAAFDIGTGDSTAIWLFQVRGGAVYFIKYIEDFGRPTANYFTDLRSFGYRYADIFLPHDANNRSNRSTSVEQVEATTLLEDLKEMLPDFNFKTLPRNSNYQAIDLARGMFTTFYFDEKGCELGLQRLGGYHYEWSENNKIWSKTPKHDENSHGADAFQYSCMALKDIQNNAQIAKTQHIKPFVPKAYR